MNGPRVHVVHPGASMHCSVYALHTAGGVVLIDAGSGFDDQRIVAGLLAAGHASETVAAVLLTHCHMDHALGSLRWRDRGAQVFASDATAEILRNADPQIWRESPERVPRIEVDRVLRDGESFEVAGVRLQVIHTPGHTRGCVSYIMMDDSHQRVGFTGDLLMPDPRHPGWAGGPDFSVPESLASLRRLRPLELDIVHTGHGSVLGDASAWLSQGLTHGERGQWILKGR